MKLHLGCGQRYLDGYINVDFPLTEHTVQYVNRADVNADILSLRYPAGTVTEIRLHHVFEHFARHAACALVAAWQSWLVDGGCLRIEVPDLHRTSLALLNPFASRRRRGVAERHLFGSHEAEWAAHKEGYTKGQLGSLFRAYGFAVDKVTRNAWRGTFNIELVGHKRRVLDKVACQAAAREYLRQYLVDDGETETRLLDAWLELYTQQVERSWAND